MRIKKPTISNIMQPHFFQCTAACPAERVQAYGSAHFPRAHGRLLNFALGGIFRRIFPPPPGCLRHAGPSAYAAKPHTASEFQRMPSTRASASKSSTITRAPAASSTLRARNPHDTQTCWLPARSAVSKSTV